MKSIAGAFRKLTRFAATRSLLAWERAESGVSYHPRDTTTSADPYGKYAELRSKDPVHRLRLVNGWLVTRYRDMDSILRDYKRFSNRFPTPSERTPVVSMLARDPPDHTRLRSLVSKAFTPKAVAALGPVIRSKTRSLLDAVDGREQFELVSALAYPLPLAIIARMLGVPADEMRRFELWSNTIARTVEPVLDRESRLRIDNARLELEAFFEEIIRGRQGSRGSDMLSVLLEAEEDGERLSRDELLVTMVLLLVAGNETTRNLISSGMLALLRNPDQLQRLRDDPALLDSAVQELLRYDSPVQLNLRLVQEDFDLGGKSIQSGQVLLLATGSANRDPAVFERPDQLDIGRQRNPHMAFGRGIHYCLGAPLAALEAREAIAALLERYSSIRLVPGFEPEYQQNAVLRGLKELRIQVTPRTRGGRGQAGPALASVSCPFHPT